MFGALKILTALDLSKSVLLLVIKCVLMIRVFCDYEFFISFKNEIRVERLIRRVCRYEHEKNVCAL